MAKKSTAKRLLAAVCMMLAAAGAWAMPTKNELAQAQQLVQDLTAEDLRAMKAGTKQPGEVAAAQLALADEAETEAGKYLLLQGAFKLYARAADYDAAADALARMRKEIADLPPELVVELVNGEMRRVTADKAPRCAANRQMPQGTESRRGRRRGETARQGHPAPSGGVPRRPRRLAQGAGNLREDRRRGGEVRTGSRLCEGFYSPEGGELLVGVPGEGRRAVQGARCGALQEGA